MQVYSVYLWAISCASVFEWHVAAAASVLPRLEQCFRFYYPTVLMTPIALRMEWHIFMRLLLLHSQWAKLSRSSTRICAHMSTQAHRRPSSRRGNKILHNTAFHFIFKFLLRGLSTFVIRIIKRNFIHHVAVVLTHESSKVLPCSIYNISTSKGPVLCSNRISRTTGRSAL